MLNNYNFSLPCLCSHLAVITGKQGLLYFSFYTGTCQMSDWFKEGKKKKEKLFFSLGFWDHFTMICGLPSSLVIEAAEHLAPGVLPLGTCLRPMLQSSLSLLQSVTCSYFTRAVGIIYGILNTVPTSKCKKSFFIRSKDLCFSECNRKKKV